MVAGPRQPADRRHRLGRDKRPRLQTVRFAGFSRVAPWSSERRCADKAGDGLVEQGRSPVLRQNNWPNRNSLIFVTQFAFEYTRRYILIKGGLIPYLGHIKPVRGLVRKIYLDGS